MLSLDWKEILHFWQEYHRKDVSFSVDPVRGFLTSKGLISGRTGLGHESLVVSVRCVHSEATVFPFVVHKYLVEDTLRLCVYLFLSNFCHSF